MPFVWWHYILLHRGFKDVCENSGWESLEEEIGSFSISLGVSGLSGIFFEISNVLHDVRPLHATVFKSDLSSLLLVWILELGFKFIEELGPDD